MQPASSFIQEELVRSSSSDGGGCYNTTTNTVHIAVVLAHVPCTTGGGLIIYIYIYTTVYMHMFMRADGYLYYVFSCND